jgi:hypothetical protein
VSGPATRLSLLPFLQAYDGTSLAVRLLLIPRGSPLAPLDPGNATGPSFAKANLSLAVVLTSGLADMPPAGSQTTTMVASPAPPQAASLFTELAGQFSIDPDPPAATPRRADTSIRKYLPHSYRDAAGLTQPRTPFAVTDDSYACARRAPATARPLPDRAARCRGER